MKNAVWVESELYVTLANCSTPKVNERYFKSYKEMTKKACCRGFLSLFFAYLFEDRDKLIAPSGYLLFNEIPLDHLTMRSTFMP